MAQRLPVQRINTGPQALRHAQRKLKLPTYVLANPRSNAPYVDSIGTGGIGTSLNFTHTVGSRANLLLVAINNATYNAGPPAVYCDGVAMTQVAVWNYGYVHLYNYSHLTWYALWNPTPGTRTITSGGAGTVTGTSIAIANAGGIGSVTNSGTNPSVTGLPDQLMLNMFGGWPTGGGQNYTGYTPAASLLWDSAVATGNDGLPTVIGDWMDPSGTTTFSAVNHCGYATGGQILPIGVARQANTSVNVTATTTASASVNAVVYDSTGAGAASLNTVHSWSHTIASDANCVVVVIGHDGGASPTFSGTVGSTSMTYLGSGYEGSDGTNQYYAAMLVCMNPPTGNQTITITGTNGYNAMNSVSYKNVAGYTSFTTATGPGTTTKYQALSTGAGQMLVGGFQAYTGALSNFYPNQRWIYNYQSGIAVSMAMGDGGGVTAGFGVTDSSASGSGSVALVLLPAVPIKASLAATATLTADITVISGQHYDVDSSLAVTVTETQAASRVANVDAAQVVTATITATETRNQFATSSLATTATVTDTGYFFPAWTDTSQVITATLTSTGTRNAIVDSSLAETASLTSGDKTNQVFTANQTTTATADSTATRNAIVNASLAVNATITDIALRNANVDSASQAITATQIDVINWSAHADTSQAITAKGLGTIDAPAWLGTGPGKAQGTSPLTYTDTIPVGTTYTLLFGQILCASATLPTITATIGGQSATLVDSVYVSSNSGNYLYGVCLALENPPTGSQTVTFTSNSILACAVNTVHYSGVGSLGPMTKIGQQSGQPSLSIPSGDTKYGYAQAFLYAAAAAGNGFSSYNQNQRWTIAAVLNVNGPLLIGDATGNGGTLTFSATRDNTTNSWGALLVPLAPVGTTIVRNAVVDAPQTLTASGTSAFWQGQRLNAITTAATFTITASETEAATGATPLAITAAPTAAITKNQPLNTSLSVTASMTAEMTKNLFLDADLTTWAGETFPYILPILLGSPTADLFLVKGFFITSVFTVSLDGTIVRNVGVSAALAITTSSTATLRWAAHADLFTLAITATPTAAATRSLSIDAALAVIASAEIIPSTSHPADSSLSVTAVVSSTANVDFLIDAPKQITASLTSTGKRGQYLDAPLPVTATITDIVKWAAKFQASLAVTANRDITGTRNAIVNAPLGVTATRDQYLFQTEQFDVLLVTTAGLYVLFTINLYGDADLAVTATPLVEMTRISYAAAALDISTDLPLEATRDQYVEANLDVQDSTESAVNWDSLAEATLVATAEIPALLNQGFLVSVFLDVAAETPTEMLLEALLDALLLAESLALTAEGIRDQYAEALQQIMFSTTDETQWNIKMEAVLVVPVSVLADGGSAPISSNFFVFYL